MTDQKFLRKWAFPGLFSFIFVFSIQLTTVNIHYNLSLTKIAELYSTSCVCTINNQQYLPTTRQVLVGKQVGRQVDRQVGRQVGANQVQRPNIYLERKLVCVVRLNFGALNSFTNKAKRSRLGFGQQKYISKVITKASSKVVSQFFGSRDA